MTGQEHRPRTHLLQVSGAIPQPGLTPGTRCPAEQA